MSYPYYHSAAIWGYTENMSATYMSSGNPCLDFFFHVVPDTPRDSVIQRLNLSWAHDSATTLKLICNLRGIRGTGKSDKENFYTAALWLYENHPKTLAFNLWTIAQFGYFKDLPEILYRLMEGPDVRKERKMAWNQCKKGKGAARKMYFLMKKRQKKQDSKEGKKSAKKKRLERGKVSREKRIEANAIKMKEEMEKARELRNSKALDMAKRAFERYDHDADYRLLHDQVSILFAELLKSDVQSLNSGEMQKISLAAKWCPSVDSSYDKALLLCKSIGKLMFPRESLQEYEHIGEEEYVSRVRNRLRKEVLVPLHRALKLPEVYMSAKEWGSVEYGRVASIAMRNYTNIFVQRDNKRFKDYLAKVKSGRTKIAAGALLPHEIIAKVRAGSSAEEEVAELQWKRMVDDLLEKGKLTNCIAVCDVSGSMYGTPMDVAVALGLLVSELSEEPWKGHVITFSQTPQFHVIEPWKYRKSKTEFTRRMECGYNIDFQKVYDKISERIEPWKTLKSKTEFIRKMEWGNNTDFQKVFDKILERAIWAKVREDKMIKRVFVFSDMEFDQASCNRWETDYMAIQRKYREKGYERVPEIVFWNLRDSSATPVKAAENGVALVSGFSKNLLTLFLEKGGAIDADFAKEMNPESTMEAAISGEMYQELVVYD